MKKKPDKAASIEPLRATGSQRQVTPPESNEEWLRRYTETVIRYTEMSGNTDYLVEHLAHGGGHAALANRLVLVPQSLLSLLARLLSTKPGYRPLTSLEKYSDLNVLRVYTKCECNIREGLEDAEARKEMADRLRRAGWVLPSGLARRYPERQGEITKATRLLVRYEIGVPRLSTLMRRLENIKKKYPQIKLRFAWKNLRFDEIPF